MLNWWKRIRSSQNTDLTISALLKRAEEIERPAKGTPSSLPLTIEIREAIQTEKKWLIATSLLTGGGIAFYAALWLLVVGCSGSGSAWIAFPATVVLGVFAIELTRHGYQSNPWEYDESLDNAITACFLLAWPIATPIALGLWAGSRSVRVYELLRHRIAQWSTNLPQPEAHTVDAVTVQKIPRALRMICDEDERSLIGERSELQALRETIARRLTEAREVRAHFHAQTERAGSSATDIQRNAHTRAETRVHSLEEKLRRLDAYISTVKAFYDERRAHIQTLAPEIADVEAFARLERIEAEDEAIAVELERALQASTATILRGITTFRTRVTHALLEAGTRVAIIASQNQNGTDMTQTIDVTMDRFLALAEQALPEPSATIDITAAS